MSILSLKIADYTYKISCQDGQETHIEELSHYLDEKAKQLLSSVSGYVPESQLLMMVSILVVQELFELKKNKTSQQADSSGIACEIDLLADKILELANTLKR